MPNWTPKQERQYKAIEHSEMIRGATKQTAQRIAAATVNKRRKANPSPAQLRARAAFTRMAKARAKAAKKANPPRRKVNGDQKQQWMRVMIREMIQSGHTLESTMEAVRRSGFGAADVKKARQIYAAEKAKKNPDITIEQLRNLPHAQYTKVSSLALGAKQRGDSVRYQLNADHSVSLIVDGEERYKVSKKGVSKVVNPRRRTRKNGVAKTAGKALKKVTRAVLGGVSKVAGKGAKALKNPSEVTRIGEKMQTLHKAERHDYFWAFIDAAKDAKWTDKQIKDHLKHFGFTQAVINKAFRDAKKGGYYSNPSRRRNLDHRDSSHQVKVHQHWRAGGLSQWQRAHHAGQHDLFSHGIKAKAKRNTSDKVITKRITTYKRRSIGQYLFSGGMEYFFDGYDGRNAGYKTLADTKAAIDKEAAWYEQYHKERGSKIKPPRNAPAKRNPSASAIRKKFAGRYTKDSTLYFPKGAPNGKMAKLGKLVSIKLKGGKLIKPSRKNPSAEIWLCSDTHGKLWLGCTKQGPLYSGAPGDLGAMSQIEYAESKPHLGYKNETIWFHKLGEVSGRQPHLVVNDDHDLIIKGGAYKITRAGIVD